MWPAYTFTAFLHSTTHTRTHTHTLFRTRRILDKKKKKRSCFRQLNEAAAKQITVIWSSQALAEGWCRRLHWTVFRAARGESGWTVLLRMQHSEPSRCPGAGSGVPWQHITVCLLWPWIRDENEGCIFKKFILRTAITKWSPVIFSIMFLYCVWCLSGSQKRLTCPSLFGHPVARFWLTKSVWLGVH